MKKIILSLILSCSVLLLNAQIDRSKPPVSGPAPEINLGKPKTFSLDNGLKVIVVENSKLPRAFANLEIDNYPDYEGDIMGVSSLVSSMMGNGTENQSKESYNEEVDYMGATLFLSASGGYVSSLKRYFPRVLGMMSDGLLNPLFTDEDFNKEKNILLDGIKSIQKSVPDIANQVSGKLFYGSNHPFGEFANEETVNNISLKDVKKYYQTFAKPNNAYLTIVGDVKFDEIKSLVELYFGKWKKGKLPKYQLPIVNNLSNSEINFVNMSNAVQSEIAVGNVINISMSDPDYFALRLANQILGGQGGRLYENLREDKGFTYGAYSSASTSRYVSTFTASTSVRNEVTDSAVTEIINEITSINLEDVSESKLESVKQKFVGNFIMSTEQPSTIANFATNIDKFNLPDNFYETYLENFQNVSIADIKRVSKKYFKKDNLRIIVVGKGQDVLARLENLPFEIKYFDKNGSSTTKPDFSTPTGITKETVLNKYLDAIGGLDKIKEINAVSMLAEAEIQPGMKLQMVAIKSEPNKSVMMMMMMGNTLMKMVFDGEKGSISSQGMVTPMPEESVKDLTKSTQPIEEVGMLTDDNVKFVSVEEEDGKTLNVLEYKGAEGNAFLYFDSETGLKYKQIVIAKMPDGSNLEQASYFKEYKEVNGVLFPFTLGIPVGPQNIEAKVVNYTINPPITDSDFTIEK